MERVVSRHSGESRNLGVRSELPTTSGILIMPCVYILANKRNGTLYLGVTSNLMQRVCTRRTSRTDLQSATRFTRL